jgi:hypothetical protein
MDRLLTSRIAKGLQGPISYVASLCISVGTYHTLVDQKFVQDLLPNVSDRCSTGVQPSAWGCWCGWHSVCTAEGWVCVLWLGRLQVQ